MTDFEAVRTEVATNAWTALVLTREGALETVPFACQPTPDDVNALAQRQGQGIAFKLIPCGDLSQQAVEDLVADLKRVSDYSKTHSLKPGVNFPDYGIKSVGFLSWPSRLFQFLVRYTPFR